MYVLAPVSPGDLLDKCSILEIKIERLEGDKRVDAVIELDLLSYHFNEMRNAVPFEYMNLKIVNDNLFMLEDKIRNEVVSHQTTAAFMTIKEIHRYNAERAQLKRQINDKFGSVIREAKEYAGQ